MDIEKLPFRYAIVLTIVMSFATAIGTYLSSLLLISVKAKEEAEKVVIERKAKGMLLYCEKLQLAASLAAEIEFSADRGYPNRITLEDIAFSAKNRNLQKVPESQIKLDQLSKEKRASELIPFLSESEANVLNRITLHHYVVTQLRTSRVPVSYRIPPAQGGFNANDEINGIREGAAKLASIYRTKCTENQ